MPLFKQVNGKRVQLTQDEEVAKRKEWAENVVMRADEIAQEEADEAQEVLLRDSLKTKLGLTDEEMDYLRKRR